MYFSWLLWVWFSLYQAVYCLKRLVSDVTCYVPSGTLNSKTHHGHLVSEIIYRSMSVCICTMTVCLSQSPQDAPVQTLLSVTLILFCCTREVVPSSSDTLIILVTYLLIYLFKINDRRTRGPLILSEVHGNTKLAQYDKVPRNKEKIQTNSKQMIWNHTQQTIA